MTSDGVSCESNLYRKLKIDVHSDTKFIPGCRKVGKKGSFTEVVIIFFQLIRIITYFTY